MSACCGGSSKSEPTKIAMVATPQTVDVAVEQPSVKSSKSECCGDKPAKNEKRNCYC
jgi:hypothetical protein